jgi:hypothetical protein
MVTVEAGLREGNEGGLSRNEFKHEMLDVVITVFVNGNHVSPPSTTTTI